MDISIRRLKGIGIRKVALFERLGIATIPDVLQYFPREYEDRSHVECIGSVDLDAHKAVLIAGTIGTIQEVRPRRGMTILKVVISDGSGAVEMIWFNQPYKKKQFHTGMTVTAFGKIEWNYGHRQMNSPDVEEGEPVGTGLVPVYGLTDGLHQRDVRCAVQDALRLAREDMSLIPGGAGKTSYSAMAPIDAYKTMHFPPSREAREKARIQLAYEELFDLQLGLLLRRRREGKKKGIKCGPNGRLLKAFIHQLPFTLTRGQAQAFVDIQQDMEGEVPMQRLVQGDVGSGKTVVAALALAKIVENGYQGALMAPTEILATQHFEEFQRLFKGLDVSIALLTGRTGVKERTALLKNLKEGHIQILIGTHALIQDDVVFSSLGLVITDEQHRFGVRQRAALRQKGKEPHTLFMTATPIPRTLTLSIYGDLDVSSIHDMPPGRKKVKTYAVGESMRKRIYAFMDKTMNQGQQCYVVCPLVEESETMDLQAATALYERLSHDIFPHHRCGLVHGKMTGREKDDVMTAFADGQIELLVATSVIEVGVNVPNATIIVIDGAERFGLAQLHQLRGRVGRGNLQAYCILIAHKGSEETRERMHYMETIYDGFVLAEKDLILRGSGQLFGYVQHGLPDLHAADIVRDVALLQNARDEAAAYMASGVSEETVLQHLHRRFGGSFTKVLNN